MANKAIKKMATTDEVQNIANNIMALLSELGMIVGAEAQDQQLAMEPIVEETNNSKMEAEYADKQENETARPGEDMAEAMKGLEQTDSDGSTANDPAGARDLGNATDIMEDGVEEVAKMLAKMLRKNNVTKKAAVRESSSNKYLSELVKIMKSINDRQQTTEEALANVLEGLGIAKAIEEKTKVEKESNRQIRSENDSKQVLEYIMKSLEGVKEDKNSVRTYSGPRNMNAEARKSIKNFLTNGGIQKGK